MKGESSWNISYSPRYVVGYIKIAVGGSCQGVLCKKILFFFSIH